MSRASITGSMKTAISSSRKRYIAALCFVSVAILVVGVSLRPRKTPAPVQSESDFLKLQLRAQKRELQRESLFFETKAAELVARAQAVRATPARFSEAVSSSGKLILLVATDTAGLPIWATASTAGVTTTECNGRTLEEIGMTIAIPSTLADAAAFDLDDNLAGVVISCGDRRILTTKKGFQLSLEPTLSELLRKCCGLHVVTSPDRPGLDIVELDAESGLAHAGARIGDRIVEVNGSAVGAEQDLQLLTTGAQADLFVERGKRNRRMKLTLPASQRAEKGSAQ